MKNKYLCLLFLLFSLLSMSAHAQIKVEGNVFDENDTPLIGVSVVAEGGTKGWCRCCYLWFGSCQWSNHHHY